MSDTPTHRVAVVVFCEVDTESDIDAEAMAHIAVVQHLATYDHRLPADISPDGYGRHYPVRAMRVLEAGLAIGNGYLWAAPTPKGVPRGRFPMSAPHAEWQLVEILTEHAKECDSDHCSACECGWMGPDTSDSGHEDYAEHLAIVIKIAGYARRDRQPATETPHAPAETEEP